MTDAIDWAIEAAANVANEGSSRYVATLIGQDGSVLGCSMIAHGAPEVQFKILRTGQAKQVEFGGKVFPVNPQCFSTIETVSYQIVHWP